MQPPKETMMKRVLLAAVLLSFSTLTFAADVKVGVIDVRQILESSPQMKAIGNKIKKDFKAREDKIVSTQKALEKDVEKLRRDEAVMSKSDREKLEAKVIADKRQFKNMQEAFREDIMNAQNKAMQELLAKVDTVVQGIAKKENYDLILQREGVPFASKNVDISDQVIRQLNKKS